MGKSIISCDVKFAGGGKALCKLFVEMYADFFIVFGGLFPINCFFDVIYFGTPKETF